MIATNAAKKRNATEYNNQSITTIPVYTFAHFIPVKTTYFCECKCVKLKN